jgi:hypothetical protein
MVVDRIEKNLPAQELLIQLELVIPEYGHDLIVWIRSIVDARLHSSQPNIVVERTQFSRELNEALHLPLAKLDLVMGENQRRYPVNKESNENSAYGSASEKHLPICQLVVKIGESSNGFSRY